jgi:hypothetical protein
VERKRNRARSEGLREEGSEVDGEGAIGTATAGSFKRDEEGDPDLTVGLEGEEARKVKSRL